MHTKTSTQTLSHYNSTTDQTALLKAASEFISLCHLEAGSTDVQLEIRLEIGLSKSM